MADPFDEDVARFEAAQKNLTATLEALERLSPGAGAEAERHRLLLSALRTLDELREFIIRDLGTVVGNLQRVESGLGQLSEFVNGQRESLNDVSVTLAAVVDMLLTAGVLDSDALVEKKGELLATAAEEEEEEGEPPPDPPDGKKMN
jgi:hypothetical protein